MLKYLNNNIIVLGIKYSMKSFMRFFDFNFYKENYIAIVALLVSVVFIKIFNLHEILENSFLENMQLIVLVAGFITSLKAKNHKIFFNFLAMVIFLMFMREISYGRVLFAHVPNGAPDAFYPWSHYKYGWLAHVIVGIYVTFGVLYALLNKIWVDIVNIISTIKFPVWTFLASFICVVAQLLSEKNWHNSCIEETAEFVLYSLILALILIYKKQ